MTEKKECFGKMNENERRTGCIECHKMPIPDGRTFYQFCYDVTLENTGLDQ